MWDEISTLVFVYANLFQLRLFCAQISLYLSRVIVSNLLLVFLVEKFYFIFGRKNLLVFYSHFCVSLFF